jgi:hypothetical protein
MPTITASTCVRIAWNMSRSVSLEIAAVRPPSVARPSAVVIMFATV